VSDSSTFKKKISLYVWDVFYIQDFQSENWGVTYIQVSLFSMKQKKCNTAPFPA